MFDSSKQNLPEVIFILIKGKTIQSSWGLILSFRALFVFVVLILRGHLTVLLFLSIQLSGTTPSSSRSPSFQTALAYMTWKGQHMHVN